jgi:Ala-tRNA(Pro) deacylase
MQSKVETRAAVLGLLEENGIPFQLYEHAQADTIDDCLAMPFITDQVTICKNVFLCNRQQTAFYLMLLAPQTPFRTAVVSKALGVSRLSFAPETALQDMLCLTPGSVSPLGLYFDKERRVTLCCEAAIRQTPQIAFHPCDNTATVIFTQEAFWGHVLPALGVMPIMVETAV